MIPYSSIYLPDDGKKNRAFPFEDISPLDMWLEDRWVFARRVYGSVFIQKLFIQCLTFIYGLNGVRGSYFHSIQNAIVREIFNLDPKEFFPEMNKSTWVEFWDKSCEGYVTQNTLHFLSKRVNMMGPTAAIFGKDFELFMLEEESFTTCPLDILQDSIHTSRGTLNKQSFERDYSQTWSRHNWQTSWSSTDWK